MFRVIETFSGIGAQAKALERIGIEHKIVNTCDWDIGAMVAYCQIHRGGINVEQYANISDEEIINFLREKHLSMDGKKPMHERTLNNLSSEVKRILYATVRETNNFGSITDVKGTDIIEDADLLTYSFPCQDLSMCGYWHGDISGIDKNANNRSGMLWEIERILKEMKEAGMKLPQFLVMENVTNIFSNTHKKDFQYWKDTLYDLGYHNKEYRLNAKYFGIPQKRERAYMISILTNHDPKDMELVNYFDNNDLEKESIANRYRDREFKLRDVLKLDYSIDKYRHEADANQPNDTPSREKIRQENDILFDGKTINEIYVNTVTTKQDRNPNSGLIVYENGVEGKTKWRYLTPRECFLLMGFDEEDYDRAISCNPKCWTGKNLLTNEKMIRMAGNSICVDVLAAIFRQIIEIKESILDR